jgi:hypothetical protein
MQALSLAVHIPLVAFGVSFPAIVSARSAARSPSPCSRRAR